MEYLIASLIIIVIGFGILAYRLKRRIAHDQWLQAQERLRLDLFDKRLAAYERLRNAIAPITETGKVSSADLKRFGEALSGVRFLFDREMERFLRDIHEAMEKKHALDSLVNQAAGKDHGLIEQASAKSGELSEQITEGINRDLPERMEKFMRFSHTTLDPWP